MKKNKLSGYHFEDEESKANAIKAMQCLKNRERGAFLVLGPPGSGKSHLVRALLEANFSEVFCEKFPESEEDLLGAFWIGFERGYLWFDQPSPRLILKNMPLMLSSASVAFRQYGRKTGEVRENNCVVFVSAKETTLSTDIKRRMKIIRLTLNSEPLPEKTLKFTPANLASAFTEWDRRYRADPEKFSSEALRLLKGDPESYGEACAPYFMEILREIKQAKTKK